MVRRTKIAGGGGTVKQKKVAAKPMTAREAKIQIFRIASTGSTKEDVTKLRELLVTHRNVDFTSDKLFSSCPEWYRKQGHYKHTPLFVAAERGHSDIIGELIKYLPNRKWKDKVRV